MFGLVYVPSITFPQVLNQEGKLQNWMTVTFLLLAFYLVGCFLYINRKSLKTVQIIYVAYLVILLTFPVVELVLWFVTFFMSVEDIRLIFWLRILFTFYFSFTFIPAAIFTSIFEQSINWFIMILLLPSVLGLYMLRKYMNHS